MYMKPIKFKHPFVFDETYEKEMFFKFLKKSLTAMGDKFRSGKNPTKGGGRVNKKASDSPKGCSAVRTFSHSSCRILRRSANSVSETNPELMIVWLERTLWRLCHAVPTRFALGQQSKPTATFIQTYFGSSRKNDDNYLHDTPRHYRFDNTLLYLSRISRKSMIVISRNRLNLVFSRDVLIALSNGVIKTKKKHGPCCYNIILYRPQKGRRPLIQF